MFRIQIILPPWTAIESVNFKDLFSAQRLQQYSSRNSILLQVTWCIQLVHGQNIETSAEIFFIPAWSEESLLFDLNLHIKNSLLCSPASIHQLIKNDANPCVCSVCARVKDYLHDSENWARSPFDRSNFVRLSSMLRILGFHSNWMEIRCRVVLKRCINVIGRNACALAWLTK